MRRRSVTEKRRFGQLVNSTLVGVIIFTIDHGKRRSGGRFAAPELGGRARVERLRVYLATVGVNVQLLVEIERGIGGGLDKARLIAILVSHLLLRKRKAG